MTTPVSKTERTSETLEERFSFVLEKNDGRSF
jgi:hypothetical protein